MTRLSRNLSGADFFGAILLVFLGLVLFLCGIKSVQAGENNEKPELLQIAVAANFKVCLEEIQAAYEEQGGSRAVLIIGSTGRHFAQIKTGAPFDLFFAADRERPRLLEESGHAVVGTRFTYALGKLVLWVPGVDRRTDQKANTSTVRARGDDGFFEAGAVLAAGDFRHLAIANPRLAPYGLAARQTLEHLGLWDKLADKLVTGQSVGQAWQFVASGAAELGLLAGSQTVVLEDAGQAGSGGSADSSAVLPIPPEYHDPIIQQVVLLERARGNQAARDFMTFVRGSIAQGVIQAHGYRLPEKNAP
ncbi:MAG: molybdate ABC transporter substrate-binding protein [Gemmatimonadales bacterium]|nr:molybdate ABC transporter substrate-binding protein [Gemmatimonadales bacterium]